MTRRRVKGIVLMEPYRLLWWDCYQETSVWHWREHRPRKLLDMKQEHDPWNDVLDWQYWKGVLTSSTYPKYISNLPEATQTSKRGFGIFLDLHLRPLSPCDRIQYTLAFIASVDSCVLDDFHVARFLVLGLRLYGSFNVLINSEQPIFRRCIRPLQVWFPSKIFLQVLHSLVQIQPQEKRL